MGWTGHIPRLWPLIARPLRLGCPTKCEMSVVHLICASCDHNAAQRIIMRRCSLIGPCDIKQFVYSSIRRVFVSSDATEML